MHRFINILSEERASAYKLSDTETNKDVLNRYLFNIALGKSFYTLLDMFEICLRNRINNIFMSDFGTNWIIENDFFDDQLKQEVAEIVKRLEISKKDVTNNRLVSELNLGFWTHLFNSKYRYIWQQNKRIIRLLKGETFSIKEVSKELTIIRKFRNRVFHFETLFTHHPEYCHLLIIRYLTALADNDDFMKIVSDMDEVKNFLGLSYNNLKELDLIVNELILVQGEIESYI